MRGNGEAAAAFEDGNCDWARLYTQAYEDFKAIALHMCGTATPPETVEDIIHDSFLAGLENIDQLRDPINIRAWMIGILCKKCQQYCAGRIYRKHVGLKVQDLPAQPQTQDTGAGAESLGEALCRFLVDLLEAEEKTGPREQTLAYILVLLQTGREPPSRKQMARELHCTESAAKHRWCQATRILRNLFWSRWHGDAP